MIRRAMPALLAGLLVLAGCSGVTGPAGPDGSPGGTGETPAADSTTGDGVGPQWLNGTRINGTWLVFHHVKAMNRTEGYRVEANVSIDRTRNRRSRRTVIQGSMSPPRLLRQVENHFSNDSTTLTWSRARYGTPDTEYGTDRGPRYNGTDYWRYDSYWRGFSLDYRTRAVGFRSTDDYRMLRFRYDGTLTRDGRTLYRFRSETLSGAVEPPLNWTNPNATLLVDGDRIIREFRLRMSVPERGWTATKSMRTTTVGDVTVEEPDWTDEARRRGN